jgi:hypothetical protein
MDIDTIKCDFAETRSHNMAKAPILADTNDPLFTRREVAERWRQSTETIKRREKAGLLHALKLGRSIRYRLSDIRAFEADAEIK